MNWLFVPGIIALLVLAPRALSPLTRKIPHNAYGQKWSVGGRMTLRNTTGEIYLRRLRLIQTPLFGVLLHHIDAADETSGAPHDHPWYLGRHWSFASVVLRGGYRENLWTLEEGPVEGHHQTRLWQNLWHLPGKLHLFPSNAVHKIVHVRPGTMTLVLCGRRKDSWHFYDQDAQRLVPWQAFLTAEGRDPLGTRIDTAAPVGEDNG